MAVKKTTKPTGSISDYLKELSKKTGVPAASFEQGTDFESDKDPSNFIPTGVAEIDSVLGEFGGIIIGSLIEFCGLSQSGKTYVAYKHAAEHQKLGRAVAYLDVENGFFAPRAADCGVNLDPSLFVNVACAGSAEKYADIACDMASSGMFGLIIVDSVKALVPQAEIEKSFGDVKRFAEHASFMQRFLNKLMPLAAQSRTSVILINQFRTANSIMPGKYELAASGGKTMEFNCRTRLFINRIMNKGGELMDIVDGETVRVGRKSKCEVYKLNTGTAGKIIEFPIFFGANEGNPVVDLFNRSAARPHEFIVQTGRGKTKTYKFIDKSTGEVLAEHAEMLDLVGQLFDCPPPSERTRGDNSQNGFEYICGRLKITAENQAALKDFWQRQVTLREMNEGVDLSEEDSRVEEAELRDSD